MTCTPVLENGPAVSELCRRCASLHHGPDLHGIDRIQGCGAIDRASGDLPSDHQLDTDKGIGHRAISRTRAACSGVKTLRNPSCAKAASRSLDPFRARREPDRRRPTKNGLCAPNKELEAKPRRTTSRIDLPKPLRNVTVTIDNRSSAFPDIASPHPLSAAERQARRRARRSPVERTPSLGAGAAPPATASA
jgi:hypothetical protein